MADENFNDYFLRFIFHIHEDLNIKSSTLELAMIDVDLSDAVLLKIMDNLVLDFPESP
jgi:hypothetical protein